MSKYKIIIEYDGTDYIGWQKQENGKSIQQTIEDSIEMLTSEKISLYGAGRTDAGVHAFGQVGHFEIKNLTSEKVDECALSQLIPSGWEIENLRLNKENMPGWSRQYPQNKIDYTDIRDDRINWFFDLDKKETKHFLVKLNAITKGHFILPPTTAEAMYDDQYKAIQPAIPVSVH